VGVKLASLLAFQRQHTHNLMSTRKPFIPEIQSSFFSLAFAAATVVFLSVFMEWLFAVTRPSFIEYVPFTLKIAAFLTDASLITVVCIFLLLPIILLKLHRKLDKAVKVYSYFYCAILGLILACLVLLLVDNFSYTLFKYGIVSTKGIMRGVYAAFFVAVALFLFKKVIGLVNGIEKRIAGLGRLKARFIFGLAGVFLAAWIVIPFASTNLAAASSNSGRQQETRENLPDIVLITVDGLNAESMSLYGYKNDTTPFLRELASTSLVAENAFSNAQGTIGSVTSILTGKYPADTRVLRSVDILEGKDSYQNLPAILKSNGYHTAQLAYSYYADAYRVNFQRAFDSANGKSYEQSPVFSWLALNLPTHSVYFLQEMYSRLTDRLGHIFFIQDMTDPYRRVTEAPEKINDVQKLDAALTLLESEADPVFIHIHWMGTHGPKFYPAEQVFSNGVDISLQGKFDPRLYDDSILEFDQAFKAFYHEMESKGLAENTLFIIASDHSLKWTASRLPMLFHFPASNISGLENGNVQNLDIAPTILDYLGIDKPAWMSGSSLLQPGQNSNLVFIAAVPKSTKNPDTGKIVYPEPEPPFYQFGRMTVVSCDRWYRLNLDTLVFDQGKVKHYQGDCGNDSFGIEDALKAIAGHLAEFGFDVESLHDTDASQP